MQKRNRGWAAAGIVPLPWLVAALVGLCMAISGISVAWRFSVRGYLSNQDSWAPMQAAIDLLRTSDAGQLYETLFFGHHVKLQYPPTSLLPLQVLDAIGAGSAVALNSLNIGFVLLDAILLAVLADLLIGRRFALETRLRAVVATLGAASAFTFYPVIRGLQLGQIQIWLDLGFTAACLLLMRGRNVSAGLVMGFASLVKPQFLPLLLLSALRRQWRFEAGFALVATVLGMISLWCFGLHNHLEYVAVLRYISRHGEAFYSNNSINGIANRLLANGSNLEWTATEFAPYNSIVFAVTIVGALLFTAIPFLLLPRRDNPISSLLHFCFATTCFVVASPVVWEHHYGIIPVFFIVTLSEVLSLRPGHGRLPGLLALSIAWTFSASKLDAVTNMLSSTLLNPIQASHFIGGVILLLVAGSMLRMRPRGTYSSIYPATDTLSPPKINPKEVLDIATGTARIEISSNFGLMR